MEDFYRAWTILKARIRRYTRSRMSLFSSRAEYASWLNSVTNHGLALAIKDRANFDPTQSSFAYWAWLKVRSIVRDDLAREARYFELKRALEQPAPQRDEFERVLLRDQIDRALTHLSQEQQEVISLFYEADLTIAEIAHLMKRQRNAVDALLFRARAKLREVLGGRTLVSKPSARVRSGRARRSPRARSDPQDEEDPDSQQTSVVAHLRARRRPS